jgi:hypothetical protein
MLISENTADDEDIIVGIILLNLSNGCRIRWI